jgi:hypothetical protein
VWHLLSDAGRKAVEVAERHADGGATNEELHAVQPAFIRGGNVTDNGVHHVAAPSRLFRSCVNEALSFAAWAVEGRGLKHDVERLAQCGLIRDVFGPLRFRQVRLDPAVLDWSDGAAVRLARAAYDERRLPEGTLDPARLAVLADALEDSGCADADLLGHLRGSRPHVRGCWALDLVLGRE